MATRIRLLEQEVVDDPRGRNYRTMTIPQATADINSEYEKADHQTLIGQKLLAVTDGAEFNALPGSDQQQWQTACLPENVIVTQGAFVVLRDRLFPPGSTTNTNIENLRTEPCTRAEKIGVGVAAEGEMEYVMGKTGVGRALHGSRPPRPPRPPRGSRS